MGETLRIPAHDYDPGITLEQVAPHGVIGRDPELAAVDAFLATADGLSALVLVGEAGIGKTTIWLEGVRRARARGATVLVARPAEVEREMSFAALSDLFTAIPDAVPARLPDPQRRALAAALLQESAPAPGIDEAALCTAFLSVLRALSTAAEVVVAIDDAQWLDSPTARPVGFAARRLDSERVRILATARGTAAVASSVGDAVDADRRQVVEVGAMSLAALHEVVKLRTGRSVPRPRFVQVAQVSAGNPLYALEIVSRQEDTSDRARVPVPAGVSGLVEARLARLPAATRRALLVAAALSQPTVDAVDRKALAPAEDAGIISIDQRRIRFAHPLFASAVYDRADASTRRRVHRSLVTRVDDPEERARHLALATTRPDDESARELETAGALAAARGAPDAAARMLELALDLTPKASVDARAHRQLAAAGYWFDAGDLGRARALLESLLERPSSPPAQARALQRLCQLHARQSTFVEAVGFAQQALVAAGDDTTLRVSIALDLTYCSASMGDFDGARTHAGRAVEAAESGADPHALAHALGALTISDFMSGQGLDSGRLERALTLEDPAHPATFVLRPSYIHGCLLLWMGQPAAALAVHEALLTRTLERGEESAVPMLTLYLIWSCLWLGDVRRAAQLAHESRETAALLGDVAAEGIALAAGALVHAHDGSAALAREEAAAALAIFDRLQWLPGTIWPLWALGLTALSDDDPSAVDAALGPLAEFITSTSADVSLGVFLPDEIEALVELGETARAETLTRWLEQRADDLDRQWARALARRCRGLLFAANRNNDQAIAELTAALVEHERCGLPLERARTLLVLGRVLRRAGKRAQAKAALTDALATFEDAGARLWASRTQAELDRVGTRARRPEALTTTEARIAELAAIGLSNREIAERAFLTVKAVEANLTRVYRKLDVRSRVQLVRILRSAEQD